MTEATISCLPWPPTPPGEATTDSRLPARLRSRRWMDWLTSIRAAVAPLSPTHLAQDELFWESFLIAVGNCRDAEAHAHLVRDAEFEEFRRFFTAKFADYARHRDLKRGRVMFSSYARRGGIDGLTLALRDFLTREAAALVRATSRRPSRRHGPPHRRMAVVGCGACPETLLFYAQQHAGAIHLTGLDVNRTALEIARDTFARFGVANVEFRQADGAEFDYGDFDVVHVANYVAPKMSVLKAIARTAPQWVTTVVRTPKLLETLICEELDDPRGGQFEEVFRLASQYCQMDSVYLQKGEGRPSC